LSDRFCLNASANRLTPVFRDGPSAEIVVNTAIGKHSRGYATFDRNRLCLAKLSVAGSSDRIKIGDYLAAVSHAAQARTNIHTVANDCEIHSIGWPDWS
jgi:hypothetical protein